jgi:FixJ family two-component response regulator
MNINSPLITVIDDDESVRESLPDLIREFGFSVNSFASAEAFLESDALEFTDCLILDIGMPKMSGPDLQIELKRRQQKIPIVFITANVEETDRHGLIKNGAIDCLFKPFTDTDLLRAVNTALQTG